MQYHIVKFSNVHISAVSGLLIRVFPTTPSSQLGKSWLFTQYQFLLGLSNFWGFVATDDSKIIGFVCGMTNWDMISEKIKKLRISHIVAHPNLFIGYLIRSLFQQKKTEINNISQIPIEKESRNIVQKSVMRLGSDSSGVRLWVIAVDHEYRGTGLAKNLINYFEESVKLKNSQFVWLTVDTNNNRARQFYEHQNWDRNQSSKNTTIYMKRIP